MLFYLEIINDYIQLYIISTSILMLLHQHIFWPSNLYFQHVTNVTKIFIGLSKKYWIYILTTKQKLRILLVSEVTQDHSAIKH